MNVDLTGWKKIMQEPGRESDGENVRESTNGIVEKVWFKQLCGLYLGQIMSNDMDNESKDWCYWFGLLRVEGQSEVNLYTICSIEERKSEEGVSWECIR